MQFWLAIVFLGSSKSPNQFSEEDEDPADFVEHKELRKETVVENLKLGAFLSGRSEYTQSEEKLVESQSGADDDPKPNIPLLDRHAQGALRRKIVHDQLDRW